MLQKYTQSVPEENNKPEKENMEEGINQWSKGKANALEELIDVTKERDSYQIETCGVGKTVRNQKQVIAHSLKEHEKCASDVQYEVDTIQERKTRFLYQVKMIQKENSDITVELSNMVAKHAHA